MGFTEFHREIKTKTIKTIEEVKLIWIIFIPLF